MLHLRNERCVWVQARTTLLRIRVIAMDIFSRTIEYAGVALTVTCWTAEAA